MYGEEGEQKEKEEKERNAGRNHAGFTGLKFVLPDKKDGSVIAKLTETSDVADSSSDLSASRWSPRYTFSLVNELYTVRCF